MAEVPGSTNELLQRLREVADPAAAEWSPADFVRASQRAASKFLHGDEGVERPMGALRFHGAGVQGHTMAMRTAGLAMTSWQKLVTDVYAATQGFRNIRGRLPNAVQFASALQTQARALPGSVVFDFQYDPPDSETGTLFDSNEPPAKDPVEETLHFLGAAERNAVAVDATEFFATARELGPRATSSLRAFAELLSDQTLDLDVAIYPDSGLAQTVETSSEAFKAIVSNIDRGKVLHDDETLEGELLALSDRKKEIEIKPPEGDWIKVSFGTIDLTPFSIGQRVRVLTHSEWKTTPAGEVSVRYSGLSIEPM